MELSFTMLLPSRRSYLHTNQKKNIMLKKYPVLKWTLITIVALLTEESIVRTLEF
jgi:hypothetical protein